MEIQLTKNKTINIGFPRGGRKPGGKSVDIVGVELFSGNARGCPAVRLRRRKGMWRLAAAAMVPPPNGTLPEQWDDVTHQPRWSLPHAFQTSGAAIAVNSSAASFSQATPEAIVHEMMYGVGSAPGGAAAPGPKRLGVQRRSAPTVPAVQEKPGGGRQPAFPKNGVPVSENGRRFTVKPFADDGFCLAASMPEFQALWLSRLLPEGRRPTAVSIQLAEAALMASVLVQPEYIERNGSVLAVFVRDEAVWFGGYKNGMPVLWRKCPGARGYRAMVDAVKKTLGIGDDLVAPALEESLVDPRPALEPFLHPVMEQLELARAYLSGKHGVSADRVLLSGLPFGAAHWRRLAEETLHIQMAPVEPFGGITLDKGVKVDSPADYLVALGAALAAAEATI
ncbi:MAG: hypothetical protein J6T01_01150 [Kiritimatiellae bacterium]|nr:hypothetical protein [Kiritimatiellia bacterium]